MMDMSMLAPTSPQSLYPLSWHANMLRIFRPAGIFVGADLPAKPLSSVVARQHAQDFSGLPASLLAPTSPQSLYPLSWHANMLRIFPACRHLCWRRPPRKAFILRRGTPTCSGFFWPAGIFVGADLSAKPLSFVVARQRAQDFSGLPAPKNERTCIRKAISA